MSEVVLGLGVRVDDVGGEGMVIGSEEGGEDVEVVEHLELGTSGT